MPVANPDRESPRPRLERLKSPLERREVRLRGLHRRISAHVRLSIALRQAVME